MDTSESGMEGDVFSTGDGEGAVRERGMELLGRWMEGLEALIRERPGAALLGALGLGFVIGRLIRR